MTYLIKLLKQINGGGKTNSSAETFPEFMQTRPPQGGALAPHSLNAGCT